MLSNIWNHQNPSVAFLKRPASPKKAASLEALKLPASLKEAAQLHPPSLHSPSLHLPTLPGKPRRRRRTPPRDLGVDGRARPPTGAAQWQSAVGMSNSEKGAEQTVGLSTPSIDSWWTRHKIRRKAKLESPRPLLKDVKGNCQRFCVLYSEGH